MNIEEFSEMVRSGVEIRLHDMGIERELKLLPVEKSNGRHLTGLVYETPRNNVTPCIYLNELFDMYEDGTGINDIIERTALVMAEQSEPDIDYQRFMSFDTVKDNMTFQLMEYEKNKDWLADKVYESMADFAKVVHISFPDGNGGMASTVLKKEFLSVLNITEEDALQAAQEGINNQEVTFVSLGQLMQQELGIENLMEDEDDRTVYVLTNSSGAFGAAVISKEGLLQEISEKIGGSFYVLPSSVHELLIVPMNGAISREELSNMVREVNAKEVSEKDFLSDRVQIYSVSKGKLMNAETYEQQLKNKIMTR